MISLFLIGLIVGVMIGTLAGWLIGCWLVNRGWKKTVERAGL